MKRMFRYSIIRFQPFLETGEFANIGVLVNDIEYGQIDYKLARSRFARIRDFFGNEAYEAYSHAISFLRNDLSYGRHRPFWTKSSAQELYDFHLRPRETSVVFSDSRNIMFDGPVDDLTEKLYARFIERRRNEVAELHLISDIRNALKMHAIRGFKATKIEDPIVSVTFPLAHENGDFKAIHPLAFSQKTPLGVFDYAAHWKNRLHYLLEKGRLKDRSVLLAIEEPKKSAASPLQEAYTQARRELDGLPFEVVQGMDENGVNPRILEFAEASVPPSATLERLFH